MTEYTADISENNILALSPELLAVLLKDNTSQGNIYWATDNYAERGKGYQFFDQITIEAITGENGNVIVPRALKSRQLKKQRSRKMAEVFTPAWVCNLQNNLVDNAWFGRENVFNTEINDYPNRFHTWKPSEGKIAFPEDKTWYEYVSENRIEITCGEAPYLASRYDAVTGETIPINMRIGMLDRKLRIVGENTTTEKEWLAAAKDALCGTYGFEWQGDNIVLARENLLFTMLEYYHDRFGGLPPKDVIHEYAYIVSWNIWQMDGLKMVLPRSCHDERIEKPVLFGDPEIVVKPCPGCKKKDYFTHNGVYCNIMDWKHGECGPFVSILKRNREEREKEERERKAKEKEDRKKKKKV